MPSHKYFALICKALLIGGVLFLFLFLFYKTENPSLPTKHSPLQFYSNQTGNDLKKIFSKAIENTKKNLFLQIYGFTDERLIQKTLEAEKRGVNLQIFYDPSGSHHLEKKIPAAIPILIQGLMHKKILVLDQKQVFIGSANFTPTSLCMHDNVVIGLYNKELAFFLENSTENRCNFNIDNQTGELWLLPDFQNQCLTHLLKKINNTKDSIQIALFTFTHPKIIEALICAKKRGVSIEVAIDFYSAKGASKKAIEKLHQENISIYVSGGGKLLHHKWAILDQETLILGSANWTTSAFKKNEDCILILDNLTNSQINYFSKIWKDIKSNCTHKGR